MTEAKKIKSNYKSAFGEEMLASLDLSNIIVEAALSKKAREVVRMDMRTVSGIADYFVICTGDADQQVKARTCIDTPSRLVHHQDFRLLQNLATDDKFLQIPTRQGSCRVSSTRCPDIERIDHLFGMRPCFAPIDKPAFDHPHPNPS